MKLFHYTTNGINDMFLMPSNVYDFSGNLLIDSWPKVVFLTTNPYWEPSIQTVSRERHYEKCGSCPEVNAELGIPSYRVQVEVDESRLALVINNMEYGDKWKAMLLDALKLGSDIRQWFITEDMCYIKGVCVWKNEMWTPVRDIK